MKENAPAGVNCCVPPVAGLRMLVFADGSRTGVMGLDAVLWRPPPARGGSRGATTAEEIVMRLAVGNYVPRHARSTVMPQRRSMRGCAALMEERARHAAGERPAPAATAGGGGL